MMIYLLFGASGAFGETDYENAGWAGHLRKQLDSVEKHRVFYNLCIPGETSSDVLKRIENEASVRIKGKNKEGFTIIIAIGTNDSKLEDGKPKVNEELFYDNITKLIRISKGLAGKVIMIGGNPVIESKCNPWKGKGYYLNERLKKYGKIMKDCSKKEGAEYVEVFSKLEKIKNLDSFYDDGLHLNGEGHKMMYDMIKGSIN